MSEINLEYEVAPNSLRECRFCRTRIKKGEPMLKFYMSQKWGFICEPCTKTMREMFEVKKLQAEL